MRGVLLQVRDGIQGKCIRNHRGTPTGVLIFFNYPIYIYICVCVCVCVCVHLWFDFFAQWRANVCGLSNAKNNSGTI